MQVQRQGEMKYPKSTVIRSSNDLGWSTIFAEHRTHRSSQGSGALGSHLEVAIAPHNVDEGVVTSKVAGKWHRVPLAAGTIWLNPIGAKADEICISSPEEYKATHLYIPTSAFTQLSDVYNLPTAPGHSIRYSCGVQDPIIRQIGLTVLAEMECPTAAGRMLVETSSLFLAARLVHAHAEMPVVQGLPASQCRLDNARLKRVLAYIEDHLAEEITVADLAGVASLSMFHFTRAFAAAMGVPPNRYVSQRRLEAAKVLLASGKASLSEIAFSSQFSSQSGFTRAFKRATGTTPADYRRQVR